MSWTRDEMVARAAAELRDGDYVNLGIGLPTRIPSFLPPGVDVVLHSENGILGVGPYPAEDEIDPDLINAGKIPVTELPGAAYFHHADSFAMMRGGHLDLCVLGAYQVSASGDLANWHTGEPGAIPAVGGAMDLAVGAKRVFVLMSLFTRTGEPKLVQECSYPLTALRCVDRIYTDHATFEITGGDRVLVRETWGISFHELRSRLDVPLAAAAP